jgi:hypothetical protein
MMTFSQVDCLKQSNSLITFFSKFNKYGPLCNDYLCDRKFFPALADRDRVNFSLFHISKCLTEIVEEQLERY